MHRLSASAGRTPEVKIHRGCARGIEDRVRGFVSQEGLGACSYLRSLPLLSKANGFAGGLHWIYMVPDREQFGEGRWCLDTALAALGLKPGI